MVADSALQFLRIITNVVQSASRAWLAGAGRGGVGWGGVACSFRSFNKESLDDLINIKWRVHGDPGVARPRLGTSNDFGFRSLASGAVALDVLASGQATPSALAARQRSRLVALLNAAVRGSVLYRELLQGRAPGAWPLHALPKVCRGELMARFDDWVTDPELKLAELRAFTANP